MFLLNFLWDEVTYEFVCHFEEKWKKVNLSTTRRTLKLQPSHKQSNKSLRDMISVTMKISNYLSSSHCFIYRRRIPILFTASKRTIVNVFVSTDSSRFETFTTLMRIKDVLIDPIRWHGREQFFTFNFHCIHCFSLFRTEGFLWKRIYRVIVTWEKRRNDDICFR